MRKQREEKGITLIALIITIIVLLILAGVSIAMLTGENGILKRAENTQVTQAQAELTEEAKLAIMESLIDIENAHTIENVIKIMVANSYISLDTHMLKELLSDDENMTGDNYVSDGCESVQVIDKTEGVSVIISEETNGDIKVEAGGIVDVANMRDIKMTFTKSPDDGSVGNAKVTITVRAELEYKAGKEKSTITKIIAPDGSELELTPDGPDENGDIHATATYTVTQNGTYTFKAEETHGSRATGSKKIENAQYQAIGLTSNLGETEWGKEAIITVDYDALFKIEGNNKLQYSTNNSTWNDVTITNVDTGIGKITVTENSTIYVRYLINNIGGTAEEIEITRIDKIAPTGTVFEVAEEDITVSTFEIKITTVATENGSGVEKYEAIVTLGETEKVVELQETDGEIKATVEGLSQATTYKVKVRTTDRAENSSETAEQDVITKEEGIQEKDADILYNYDTDLYSISGAYIVTIPAGFKVEGNASGDFYSRNTLSQGIVIEDVSGNEYVWVPAVYESNASYKKLKDIVVTDEKVNDGVYTGSYFNGAITATEPTILTHTSYDSNDKYKEYVNFDMLMEEFVEMKDSIESRGGFYIMRYEMSAGVESKSGVTSLSAAVADVTDAWYGLYTLSKTYSNSTFLNGKKEEESVQPRERYSLMIANSQYDIMMDWMTSTGTSTAAGNVADGTHNGSHISGATDGDKLNNIYDLRGSRYEWTTAASSTSSRVYRGGHSSNTTEASDLYISYPTFYGANYRVSFHFNLVALATVH